jgi:hypothetical protein
MVGRLLAYSAAWVVKELAGLLDEPVGLHPDLASIDRKVAALQGLLEDALRAPRRSKIIRPLIDPVIFRPPDAGLEIELVGNIAKTVALPHNRNENSPVSGAVHEESARSVNLVAGARNSHPHILPSFKITIRSR